MTDDKPIGNALEAGDLSPAVVDDDVRRLVAAWLLGFASENTRRSYAGDLSD